MLRPESTTTGLVARVPQLLAMAALNALDAVGDKTTTVADAIKKLPKKPKVSDVRYAPFVPDLVDYLAARFK